MSTSFRWLRALMVVVSVLGVTATERASAEKLLRWKYQTGETLQFELVQQMKQKLNPGEGAPVMDFTTTQTMDMTWKVNNVDAQGLISLSQTFTRAQIKMQSPQGVVMDYDSASGKEPDGLAKMLVPMFDAMINKPMQIKLTDRGEVKDMKLPAGMVESINKVAGGGQTTNLFSEDWIRQLGESCVFPQEPVVPGKTWTHLITTKNPFVGEMVVTNALRYEGTEERNGRPVEKITVSMQFKLPDSQKSGMIGIKEQTGQGTVYFDAEAGKLQESTNRLNMKMDISLMGRMMKQDLEMNMIMKPKTSQP